MAICGIVRPRRQDLLGEEYGLLLRLKVRTKNECGSIFTKTGRKVGRHAAIT